jgi:translation elongation factor EF-4
MNITLAVAGLTYIEGRSTAFFVTLKEGRVKKGQKLEVTASDISVTFTVRAIQDAAGDKLVNELKAGEKGWLLAEKALPKAILNNLDLQEGKTSDYHGGNLTITEAKKSAEPEVPWWQFWRK